MAISTARVATRFKQSAEIKALSSLLNRGLDNLVAIEGVARGADKTLLVARVKSLSLKGRIWQSSVVKVLQSLDPLFAEIDKVRGDLKYTPMDRAFEKVVDALDVPKPASVDYAIADIEFETNPSNGVDEITYNLERLRSWITNLKQWSEKSQSVLRRTLQQLK